MTPEEQRIAIAEACGFVKVPCPNSSLAGNAPFHPQPKTFWAESYWGKDVVGVPDYLNDLNAMHEAEKILRGPTDDEESERSRYSENIILAVANGQEVVDVWYWEHITATAAQRAEAFLRTIGKWVDTK